MKKILVIGPNSYIAKNFISYCKGNYDFDFLSVRDNRYLKWDYSIYDSIIYFAAIVHQPQCQDENLYRKVNAIIPGEIASLASKSGCAQFIYISSVAVWGLGPKFAQENEINRMTPINPKSLYGITKAEGEDNVMKAKNINWVIVRLPNVYGENCPGTFYPTIVKLSSLKIFPSYYKNLKFSLISVKNIAVALKRIIDGQKKGVFVPQDNNIVSIQQRVQQLSIDEGRRQIQTPIFSPIFWIMGKFYPSKYTNNLFGGFYINPNEFATLTD